NGLRTSALAPPCVPHVAWHRITPRWSLKDLLCLTRSGLPTATPRWLGFPRGKGGRGALAHIHGFPPRRLLKAQIDIIWFDQKSNSIPRPSPVAHNHFLLGSRNPGHSGRRIKHLQRGLQQGFWAGWPTPSAPSPC